MDVEDQETSSLITRGGVVASSVVEAVLQNWYGIECKDIKKLVSERDENFRIVTPTGQKLVAKFMNPYEDRTASNFQTEIMHHINRIAPHLPIQFVLATVDGALEAYVDCGANEFRTVRIVTYLDGQVLSAAPRTVLQSRNLGDMAGQITLALEAFSHPGQTHELLWDLQHARKLRKFFAECQWSPEQRAMLEPCINRFEANVVPKLENLKKQVVHNDYNPSNVLVDANEPDKIAGILDFGDAVYSAVIFDIAVGATYTLGVEDSLLDAPVAFTQAYLARVPVPDSELRLLYDLMLTRLFLSLVISHWRTVKFPENRDYILRNASRSWDSLEKLLALENGSQLIYDLVKR